MGDAVAAVVGAREGFGLECSSPETYMAVRILSSEWWLNARSKSGRRQNVK